MGVIDLNFGSVGKVPQGDSFCIITNVRINPPKQGKENPVMEVDVEIAEIAQEELAGTSQRFWLAIAPGYSMEVLQNFLEAATGMDWKADGMKIVTENEDGTGELVEPSLVGLSIGITWKEGEYNGKPSASPEKFFRP